MATHMRKVYYYLQDVEWWEETEVNTGSIPSEPTFSVSFFFYFKEPSLNHCAKLSSAYSLMEYLELVEPN